MPRRSGWPEPDSLCNEASIRRLVAQRIRVDAWLHRESGSLELSERDQRLPRVHGEADERPGSIVEDAAWHRGAELQPLDRRAGRVTAGPGLIEPSLDAGHGVGSPHC